MTGELVPAGVAVVEGEVVSGELQPARPWQTQAERDRVIENADAVLEHIRGRLSANTRASYKSAWRRFARWAAERGRTPYPLTLETLLSYLGYLAKWRDEKWPATRPSGVSVAVMEQFLAIARRVCLADIGPGDSQGWVGAHIDVTDFVADYRAKRNRNPETRPRRAIGARMVIMRALLDALPDSNSGVRDRAVMLLAYYMGARRSEIANLTHDDVRYTVDGLEIYIAFSKTDQAGEGTWVAIPSNDRHVQYDPWAALQAWLALCRGEGLTCGPLFRAVHKTGVINARGGLHPRALNGLVDRARLEAYGRAKLTAEHPRTKRDTRQTAQIMVELLEPDRVRLSPHSFRRGFATDARAAGWDLLEIARAGRWSPTSRVLHIYVEEVERWLRHQTNPMLL